MICHRQRPPAQTIHDLLGDRMGKVNRRSLSGWLRSIRLAYGELYNAQLVEMEHAESLAYQSGDLVAILGLTFAAMAPKFVAHAGSIEASEASAAQQHIFLRFLEVSTTAAKVQADAKHAEAKTRQVMMKIHAMLGNAENGDPKSRAESLALVIRAVDEHLGIGGAA